MKRYLLLILSFLGISFSALAQPIAEIWTQPAFFKADEKVVIFFDVTGTPLAGTTEDVYLWSWFPKNPDEGGPTAKSKLTHVEGNIYKFEMVPTEYYNVGVDQISEIYGLLRNQNGSKLTDAFAPDQEAQKGIQILSLTNISGTAVMDYFPKKYKSDRPLSILVNTKNTWSNCETTAKQGDLNGSTEVHIHSGANNWATVVEHNAANMDKTKMTDMGNGIFRFDMIPDEYFGNPQPSAYNVKFVFANNDWSKVGKDANCADFMIGSSEAPVVPVPVLSFFPQKVSCKDLLFISRKDNELDVTKIFYTITAEGGIEIKGAFDGNTSEFKAYIDLVSVLKDAKDLAKIHLLLKDDKGRILEETDIPLVILK